MAVGPEFVCGSGIRRRLADLPPEARPEPKAGHLIWARRRLLLFAGQPEPNPDRELRS